MKKVKILPIVLVTLMIASGCSKSEKAETKESTVQSSLNSQEINLSMVKPITINPLLNKDKSVGYVMNLIYDGLFTIDENYNVVPQLVDTYQIAQDGTSVDMKLKDANWHDKTPVTSQDVDFTIRLIQKNPDSPYYELAKNISSVSIQSEKEFTIKFKQRYPFSIDTLIFPIVSENKIGSVNTKDANEIKKNLIGNGPYKIDKYEEREGIILSKNEDYYNELPKEVKDIKVGVVPDEDALVSMVMALESDIASISLNDLSKFYEKQFNLTTYEGRGYENIIFNYDNLYLRDVNFRKAIAHAINRERIVEEGYMSDATLSNFPLNSNSKYYDKNLKAIKYDKDKAKSYLEKVKPVTDEELKQLENKEKANTKASDTKQESKEVKEKDTKENKEKEETIDKEAQLKEKLSKIDLKILVNKNNTERVKSAHLTVENLKVIGIKSHIVELEGQALDDAISSKNYDLALVGWELSIIPDARDIINSSGYSDEKLVSDENSLISATTEEQISDVYKSMQKYINDNVIFISLAIRDEYIVTNRRVQGKISPNDFDVYEGITNLKTPEK
ncbi:ABC transporter substrate-binding protein [Romboutsia lituseburensis]|uniref:ABC transporter substrate-binding protein n=1 Tax=Romboutsia lituseburensis TaxID=1537 RepID=UPI00215B4408|nr:ABC transporter substrate-binding protein [Romboutsia lituseburensis]MCR8746487.1 ABC transporter substrate-binding protein [Romboutsia lituseburensis]